jgi:hypothetical protein
MADRKITDLTSLTAPATGDLLPVIDISEAANVDKNKSITLGTLFRTLPDGTVGAPSIGFLSDSGTSGIYRTAANEVAISNNSNFTGKFTTAGFQLGTGTAAAQLHLFSTDTTDQVIIENTDAGLDTAPDLVLYRNSASPAANDNLGNIEFRGEDDGGNAHAYAQIIAGIQTTTNGAEDGILDLMTSASGTNASRIRLYNQYVGIGETAPNYPLHITTTVSSTALEIEGSVNDSASSADITLYHHRAGAAGVADDIISTVYYRSNDDDTTPNERDYAAIEGSTRLHWGGLSTSPVVPRPHPRVTGNIPAHVGAVRSPYAVRANRWMLEDAGKTDCYFYKRAVAICRGGKDPFEDEPASNPKH